MKLRNSLPVLFTFLLFSCSNLDDFSANKTIESALWDVNNICRFEYDVTDTISTKDMFINLRHSGLYKYSNIYFFVTTLAPNGKTLKDTVEYTLADARGKWAGSGIGDLYDVELAYKRNVRFAQQGRYIFYIQHGMRDKQLEAVTDVGISVRKISTN
jgi:gliding motility-associated lipoprotein GldH